MLKDSQYQFKKSTFSEIEHKYGPNIHILNDPYLFATLATLCKSETKQPLINQLLNLLYREMVKIVVNQDLPKKMETIETRMAALHPEGKFTAEMIDKNSKAVCVNLARAGTVPSQICFDSFNYILNPDGVRQDHISINRKIDADEKVIGTNLGGLKIGGPIDGAFVIIPDPMGATGSTIKTAMDIYKHHGRPAKFIALHLVITPEYLKMITREYPELIVYAIRLDRGLSTPKALGATPGTHWDEEKGLNPKQYIVPGAGGLGEVINNAYV